MLTSKKSTQDVVLRHMEDDDVDGVFNLYDTVFGPENGERIRIRWDWAYVNNPLPELSPKWVISDRGEIVGFLAAMALPYFINGERIIANTTCDYMVHPDYRFQGIKLMKEFFGASENCVTCDDMEATLKVTQWLGAKPVGNMVRYVKVLDGRFLKMRGRMASVPSPLLWPVTQGLHLKDGLKSRNMASGVKVKPVNRFDERFDKFVEKQSETVPAMIIRDSAFLNWRYGESSPHDSVDIGIVTDNNGDLEGYVIYYVSKTKGNENLGHVIDIQTLPSADKGTANALMHYAVKNLRKQGAWAAYYRSMPSSISPITYETLKDYGFLPRGRHVFMVKMKNSEIAAIAENEASWNYSFGDSEASHFLL